MDHIGCQGNLYVSYMSCFFFLYTYLYFGLCLFSVCLILLVLYSEKCIFCALTQNSIKTCNSLKILLLRNVNEIRQEHYPDSFSVDSDSCNNTLLHQLVSNLQKLKELSLFWYRIDYEELDHDAVKHLGVCFNNHWKKDTFTVKLKNSSSNIETAFRNSLTHCCRVFNVGSNPGYLILNVQRKFFK